MSSMSLPLPPATIAARADGGASTTRRPRRRGRRISRKLVGQLVRYAMIGITSTALQLGLYLVLRGTLGPLTANLISLVISNVANTAANRYFTFGITGRGDAGRHQLQGLLLFFLSLGLTSGALGLLNIVTPGASQTAELVVLVAANIVGTIARFSLMRNWVFTRRR
jgi:putative flippase GtrA